MFRALFEKVRVSGKIDITECPSIRDTLPIIYEKEADAGNVSYYNSGGRSLIFDRSGIVYRVKGVDPFGHLTKRVIESKKNCLQDVTTAHKIVQLQRGTTMPGEVLTFDGSKAFGPFSLSQARLEVEAFHRLDRIYLHHAIESPCQALGYKETGLSNGEPLYQTFFKLPTMKSDLRIHEFNTLLAARLDQCSPDQIAAKTKAIGRLYGRFVYWAGINAGILSVAECLPTENSFHSQNWVISSYKNGYGIFRVDHTSTRKVKPEESLKNLTAERLGLAHVAYDFSIFPSTVFVAANPKAFLRDKYVGQKFSQILNARHIFPIDESRLLAAHNNVFGMGLVSFLEGQEPDPISRELFEEALA